jgi:hypothetical protein
LRPRCSRATACLRSHPVAAWLTPRPPRRPSPRASRCWSSRVGWWGWGGKEACQPRRRPGRGHCKPLPLLNPTSHPHTHTQTPRLPRRQGPVRGHTAARPRARAAAGGGAAGRPPRRRRPRVRRRRPRGGAGGGARLCRRRGGAGAHLQRGGRQLWPGEAKGGCRAKAVRRSSLGRALQRLPVRRAADERPQPSRAVHPFHSPLPPHPHPHPQPQTVSYDLLPGGASMAVTNANRTLYCHLLADFHLNRRWVCPQPGGAGAAGAGAGTADPWLQLARCAELDATPIPNAPSPPAPPSQARPPRCRVCRGHVACAAAAGAAPVLARRVQPAAGGRRRWRHRCRRPAG